MEFLMNKEKFLSIYHSIIPEEKGCLIWPLGCLKGYGRVSINGKVWASHRWAYTVFKGVIPKGIFVCHKCDIRPCINPSHLFLGTHQDNVDDCISKGRKPRGVLHKSSKLTALEVVIIRSLSSSHTHAEISKRFNVCRQQITRIINRQRWRHLP